MSINGLLGMEVVLKKVDKESYDMCIKDGTPEKYPDINAACLSKHIDRCILYELFKLQ